MEDAFWRSEARVPGGRYWEPEPPEDWVPSVMDCGDDDEMVLPFN